MSSELTPTTSPSGEGINMLADSSRLRLFGVLLLIIITFLPRLTSLGTTLTVDENIWRGRGEQFLKGISAGHFEKTLTGGQPGVTTTWLVALSYPWKSLAANQAAVSLATGLLVLLITYGLTRLWGFWWGLAGGSFLALDPFLLAHSRLVHTDALFALFYLASLIFLLAALLPLFQGHPLLRRYIVLSSMLGGLALLSKIFAVLLLPTMAVIFLFTALRARPRPADLATSVVIWLVSFALTTIALWPALWVNPSGVIGLLTGRAALHVAEGTHSGETTTMWWYYIRETAFRISPIVVVLLIPAVIEAWRKRDVMRHTLVALLLAGLALATILSFSTDKSDRYVLVLFLTLTLFSLLGVRALIRWLTPTFPRAAFILPLLIIFLFAADVAQVHPYYLAYYNRLYPIEDRHKLGWGEGLEQAGTWLTENHPGEKIVSYYPSVMRQWYAGDIDPINHVDDSNAKFVVLYRSMFERGPDHVDTDIADRYLTDSTRKPVHTIYINGLPYVWIYERE